jgi:hypothetical protein
MIGRLLACMTILASVSCAEGGNLDDGDGGNTGSTGVNAGGAGTGGGTTGAGCADETCNGKDDNCDGTIDNPDLLNGLPCDTGTPGACGAGTTLCQAGVNTCVPNVEPGSQPEICNAADDDCNNMIDDVDGNDTCPTQHPSAQNVADWSCTGTCAITACTAGSWDFNASADDGCECITDQAATACGAAATTTVPLGGIVALTGVVEMSGSSDWLTFQFDQPTAGLPFHPKVELTNNAGGSYSMDVMVDCAGTAAGCSTTGGANDETGIAATVWEQSYNYVAGAGCCTDTTPRQTVVTVRLNRTTPPACDAYTVTATNQ